MWMQRTFARGGHSRRLAGTGFACLLGLLVAGCATPQLPEVSAATKRELLSGEALFGAPIPPAEPIAIQDTSPEMERFLAPLLEIDSSRERLRQLVRRLAEVGLLNARYDERLTLSAAATLEAKAGNCLSYTNMFVALARRLGLRARFQRVAVPPTWGIDGDLLIRSNHINAVVPNMRKHGPWPRVRDGLQLRCAGDQLRTLARDRRARLRAHVRQPLGRCPDARRAEGVVRLAQAHPRRRPGQRRSLGQPRRHLCPPPAPRTSPKPHSPSPTA